MPNLLGRMPEDERSGLIGKGQARYPPRGFRLPSLVVEQALNLPNLCPHALDLGLGDDPLVGLQPGQCAFVLDVLPPEHRNTSEGEMPNRLATAEMLEPGALSSASRLSFCSVVKRRRWPRREGTPRRWGESKTAGRDLHRRLELEPSDRNETTGAWHVDAERIG